MNETRTNASDAARLSTQLLVTVQEACELTRLSRNSIYELFAAGQLHSVKVGRRRLIQMTELQRFVSELPAAS